MQESGQMLMNKIPTGRTRFQVEYLGARALIKNIRIGVGRVEGGGE